MMPRTWDRSPLPQPAPPPALTQSRASCLGESARACASIPSASADLDVRFNSPLLPTSAVVWELSPVKLLAVSVAPPRVLLRPPRVSDKSSAWAGTEAAAKSNVADAIAINEKCFVIISSYVDSSHLVENPVPTRNRVHCTMMKHQGCAGRSTRRY